MTTQEILTKFIAKTSYRDIEPLALERARAAIIDGIGVALAGSVTPIGEKLRSFLRNSGSLSPNGTALLLGCPDRASASNAALYNGAITHALDYDDDCHPGSIHLTASLLPSLMSVCGDEELLSDKFCCAYVIGYEVGAKFGHILSWNRRGKWWHPTCMVGVIGCTAAIAKMLSFDDEQTMNALGIAASSASGLRANGGTMTKPLHAGRAAEGAVLASLLARQGYEASADVFDGKSGYFHAFRDAQATNLEGDVTEALGHLGQPWEICTDVGIHLKPWPSCSVSHPAIEAALIAGGQIDVNDVAEIYVGTCADSADLLIYPRPNTGLQGKFSLEFCMAAAMTWGAVTIDTFTDDRVADRGIQRLIDRMTVRVDDRVKDSPERAVVVKVTLRSGQSVEVFVEMAKGKGDRWLTIGEQATKFDDCAARLMGEERARKLFELLSDQPAGPTAEWVPLLVNS